MWIPNKYIPEDIEAQYKLKEKEHKGRVLARIDKGMYGLPQAGLLAYQQLCTHLAKHGYHLAGHTPCLFRHNTRPTVFSLIVDDFGVMYLSDDDSNHLVAALREKYVITIDSTGAQYCGLTFDWNYDKRYVDVSMPGYIERAAPLPTPATLTTATLAHAWIAPQYGKHEQLTTPENDSTPLDQNGIRRLQEVVGTLLYYARAIDCTMLVALSAIASAKTTEATARAVTQLLNYAATHPDAVARYRHSDMILWGHSDASYLTVTKARSRTGGYYYLSSSPTSLELNAPPLPPNGPILVLCSILRMVVSSATEAEMAALFYNAKEGTVVRQILEDMGHPQPATPLQTDNAVAAGIINDTITQCRSKAMDMRFYWVKDRVSHGQFIVLEERQRQSRRLLHETPLTCSSSRNAIQIPPRTACTRCSSD
jgi:hypothetical protein